jgi:mRNA interferase RelE/StbE
VNRDLGKVSRDDVTRILRQIRDELGRNPGSGERLKGEFKGLYKFRVGEYRVIYTLSGDDVVVLRIRHRAKAYD